MGASFTACFPTHHLDAGALLAEKLNGKKHQPGTDDGKQEKLGILGLALGFGFTTTGTARGTAHGGRGAGDGVEPDHTFACVTDEGFLFAFAACFLALRSFFEKTLHFGHLLAEFLLFVGELLPFAVEGRTFGGALRTGGSTGASHVWK